MLSFKKKEVEKMIATFQGGKEKRTLFFSSPTLISELLEKAEISVDFPCSKQGKCAKCKVRVTGKVSPVSDTEMKLLSKDELDSGIRLACCTFANGNIHVDYTISENYFQAFVTKLSDFTEKIDKNSKYDLLYDIGTTSIKTRIIEKQSGKSYGFSFVNPQVSFGGDVMSRLKYANDHGLDKLFECVRTPFEMIREKTNAENCVVTGNTAMLHFFEKKDTNGMLSYPFTPSEMFGYENDGIYFPPCISAFVGGDVTCGILKTDLFESNDSLFIDVGTNCEMVFYKNNELLCCSAAAGPAFEGFSASNGERAKKSSITGVFLKDGKVCFESNTDNPTGLTGSGIIDLISVLLKTGDMKKDGFLKDNYFIPKTEVFITPEDVRSIQLAKAAVRAGIDMICGEEKVEKVFVAGNFGNSVNIRNCIDIGMFPEHFIEKTVFVGNSSLDGSQLLLEKENRDKLKSVIKKCKLVELAGTDEFAKRFLDNLDF